MAAPIEAQVVAALRSLPPHHKQEVLNFARFLSTKSVESRDRASAEESRSALDLAQQWVGCIEDSPADRSETSSNAPTETAKTRIGSDRLGTRNVERYEKRP